jgi:hypothetical protein
VAAVGGWSWGEAGAVGEYGEPWEPGSELVGNVGNTERQVIGNTSAASVVSIIPTRSPRHRIRSGGISVLIPSFVTEYLDEHICTSTSISNSFDQDSEDQERSPKRQKLMPKEPKEPEPEESKVKGDDMSESSDSDSDYDYDSDDNAWPRQGF